MVDPVLHGNNDTITMKIEALHEFHDHEYSNEWSNKFSPTPERLRLFETIFSEIEKLNASDIHILELGIGPGYLANFLLEKFNNITYEGLDFSTPMLTIASKRLHKYQKRTAFTQVDLTDKDWVKKVSHRPKVIVTTWALHDLLSMENILSVYTNSRKILREEGVFLNGDFVKPEELDVDYEEGRIKASEHLQLFQSAGFSSATCLSEFEKDIHNPSPSNNYACFKAIQSDEPIKK